jgi:hypothetical protein
MKVNACSLLLVLALLCISNSILAIFVANRVTTSSISIVRARAAALSQRPERPEGTNLNSASQALFEVEKHIALSLTRTNIVHSSYLMGCVGTACVVACSLCYIRRSIKYLNKPDQHNL